MGLIHKITLWERGRHATGADRVFGFIWEGPNGIRGSSGEMRIYLTTPEPHHPSELDNEMQRMIAAKKEQIERDLMLGAAIIFR